MIKIGSKKKSTEAIVFQIFVSNHFPKLLLSFHTSKDKSEIKNMIFIVKKKKKKQKGGRDQINKCMLCK